jgi:Fe-S-cluster-containing dehydrogenase component
MQFDGEKKVAQKCDLCVARLDRGLPPACVAACPSHCIYFGEAKDILGSLRDGGIFAQYKTVST